MSEIGAQRRASSANQVKLSATENRAADNLFAAMRQAVPGIQATFGRKSEVVLHDYRDPEQSVICVAGEVTGRSVGGAMSQIGLSILRQGDDAKDELNYVTRLPDGRILKSSTLPLRTPRGHLVGALCINMDVTEVRVVGRLMSELAGDSEPRESPTTFSNEIDAVVDSVLDEIEESAGRPLSALSRPERLDVFRTLDARGTFQVRRSASVVAARLGMSRASVYNYISRARESDDTSDEGET